MPTTKRHSKNPTPEEISANAANVLRVLMWRDQLDQVELARRSGYGQSTISRSLDGSRKWRPEKMVRLADVFGEDYRIFQADPDELLELVRDDAVRRFRETLKFARELDAPGQRGYAQRPLAA